MSIQRGKTYPGNPWGSFADDPWSPALDMVTGPAWDRAVEKAREVRLALRRADDSLKRLQKEWAEEHGSRFAVGHAGATLATGEENAVASVIYRLFERAMRERRPVLCIYQGHPRAVCPIILGHSAGAEKALTFQFEGWGRKGPVRGEWKCLNLAEVSNAEIIDGPWRTGERHSQSQSCVKDVDLDINPNSPYNPKRQL